MHKIAQAPPKAQNTRLIIAKILIVALYGVGAVGLSLVYLTGTVFSKTTDNDYYAALLGATSMTVIDYIMEPVAVALDMWYWKFEIIPAGNYFGWFGVAFLIHLIYRKAQFERSNPLAPWILVAMILFFALLNFTLEI